MAKGSGGAGKAVEAVRMAGPRGVLQMIQVVSSGDFLLVLPRARVLLALGICGV